VGEGIDDLRPFSADDFVEALLARDDFDPDRRDADGRGILG